MAKQKQPAGPGMTLGNMRIVRWFAAIGAAAITTGCASSIDNDILSPYAEPGRYDFLDCATISKTLAKVSYTEKQLAQLMTRASEGAGGAMVNVMAYQDRYNTARAEMRALRKAGEAKKCSPSDLTHRQPRHRIEMASKQPAGPAMTLGNMRELGVKRLIASCLMMPADTPR